MTDFNLCEPTPTDLRQFVRVLVDQAIDDHVLKKRYRTGQQLCSALAMHWRHGHVRFAATVYRRMRWTLEVAEYEAQNPDSKITGAPQ